MLEFTPNVQVAEVDGEPLLRHSPDHGGHDRNGAPDGLELVDDELRVVGSFDVEGHGIDRHRIVENCSNPERHAASAASEPDLAGRNRVGRAFRCEHCQNPLRYLRMHDLSRCGRRLDVGTAYSCEADATQQARAEVIGDSGWLRIRRRVDGALQQVDIKRMISSMFHHSRKNVESPALVRPGFGEL